MSRKVSIYGKGVSGNTYGSIIFNGVAAVTGSKLTSDNGWITPSLNYSFSIWIKQASTVSGMILGHRVGTTNRWEMYTTVSPVNTVTLALRRGGFTVSLVTPINTIIPGTWQNITLTRSTLGVYKIYVDSVLKATSSAVATDEISTAIRKAIGCSVNNSNVQVGSSFDGNMCHASFWDKELLLAEVQELYNGGNLSDLNSHSCSANLLSWQKMDFSETLFPTVIDDASPNSNTFTSSNLALEDLVLDYP